MPARLLGERLMLSGFYTAFSPACLALLGLWLVVVQVRLREWQGSAIHRRRSYGVALNFALPGVMSLLALIDPQDPAYWRVSFAIVALGGAVALVAVRGFPVRRERTSSRTAAVPVPDQLGLAAYLAAIVLYVLIGALAFAGGAAVLRIEAVLLTVVLFLGFNVAWLLLFDDPGQSRARFPATSNDRAAADVPLAIRDEPATERPPGRRPETPSP
jgi:peptidoglycan/LPS O-acetylase OafA/YrhL